MFHAIFDREEISLNGTWKYRIDQNNVGRRQSWYLLQGTEEVWRDIQVPGNWYLNEEIGDYFGAIWYTANISVPEASSGRVFLRFEGVDYIAEAWLNGQYLGDATVASLALGYAGVDPKYITTAYETAMNQGRVVAKFSVGAIASENEVGSSLDSYRDTWLDQAVVAPVEEFDSVYDSCQNEYLNSMGGQEIINERAEKLKDVYGVEVPTDLLTK